MKVFMLKQKPKTNLKYLLSALLVALVFGGAAFYNGIVKADQFDQQIQAIKDQNSSVQADANNWAAQASSYQDQVDTLQQQIDGLQQQIVATQQQSDDVQAQIVEKQAELDQQKKVLGENIKALYLEGQISTLEILASSKDLSDFVDKEVDRNAVQNKVKASVDQINTLKLQLQQKQLQLQGLLKDDQAQQAKLQSSEEQQSQLLAYTEGQKATDDATLKANNAQIASLRAQQLAANRRLVGSGNVTILSTGSCGGDYPAVASGPYGPWGCNYGQDQAEDSWGMLNRECVSYTAFKVYQAYGYMPAWGSIGMGNADQWPGDASAYNIPTGSAPRVGSVAIGTNPYYFGSVGHAMWVEGISGDGSSILVSQYNFSSPGNYSEMWISTSLISTFIYFGG